MLRCIDNALTVAASAPVEYSNVLYRLKINYKKYETKFLQSQFDIRGFINCTAKKWNLNDPVYAVCSSIGREPKLCANQRFSNRRSTIHGIKKKDSFFSL